MVSAWSLSTIGCGVPAGAIRPNQAVASKPGKPSSSMVGRSGICGERLREVIAKARSLPSRTSGSTLEMLPKKRLSRPPSRSGRICVVPRYGTCWNLDAGHRHEQFAAEMLRGADAGVAGDEVIRLGLGERDQLLDGLGRNVGRHHHQVRHDEDLGDVGEVLERIVAELVHQVRVDDERGVAAHRQRVAVGRRPWRPARPRGCRRRR